MMQRTMSLILRKTMIAGLAGCAALAMTACGSGDEDTPAPTTTTVAQGGPVTCENPPAEPTGAELQELLSMALDPAVPAAEKAELIQGGADDPEVFDQLSQKVAEAQGVEFAISTAPGAVAMLDDCNLSVGFSLTVGPDTPPTVSQIDFVAEDGQWKLSRTHACQLVQTMALETPLCPAA